MAESVHIVCSNCTSTNRVPRLRLGDGAKCGHCKAALFAGHPVALTTANFAKVTSAGDLPIVVDFWAPWCGPCRGMAPIYERAARELEPQVMLAKVDTDAQPELAQRYGIRSIPTIAIFMHGREVARQAGAMDLGTLTRWIQSHIAG